VRRDWKIILSGRTLYSTNGWENASQMTSYPIVIFVVKLAMNMLTAKTAVVICSLSNVKNARRSLADVAVRTVLKSYNYLNRNRRKPERAWTRVEIFSTNPSNEWMAFPRMLKYPKAGYSMLLQPFHTFHDQVSPQG
jgi:hypothetical protein